jgi:DNA (cytosine-5)-methyltransferase 1
LSGGLADTNGGNASAEREQCGGQQRQQPEDDGGLRLGYSDSKSARGNAGATHAAKAEYGSVNSQCDRSGYAGSALSPERSTGPVNGLWSDADWISCRDDKWRPVEPGTFPLAHGAASRVGRLRAYGNAINAKAAEEFIGSYLDAKDG